MSFIEWCFSLYSSLMRRLACVAMVSMLQECLILRNVSIKIVMYGSQVHVQIG